MGRWISRDPIGENIEINLFKFINNNPSNYFDYNGLYNLEFEKKMKNGIEWDGDQMDAVSIAFNLLKLRMPALLKEIDDAYNDVKSLPPCCELKADLLKEFDRMKPLVEKISEGLDSDDTINLYNGIRDSSDDAWVPSLQNKFDDDRPFYVFNITTLNTHPENDFFSKSVEEQASTIFHELSHIEGITYDKTRNSDLYFDGAHRYNYLFEGTWKKRLYGHYAMGKYFDKFENGTTSCPRAIW